MTTDREIALCWMRDFPVRTGGCEVWIAPEADDGVIARGRTTGLPSMVEHLGPGRSKVWIVPVMIGEEPTAVRITRIEPVMEPQALLRYLCGRSHDSARALVRSGAFSTNPALAADAVRVDAVAGALVALLGTETEPVAHVPWGMDLRWPGAPPQLLAASAAALRRVPEAVRRTSQLGAFVPAVDALVALLPREPAPMLSLPP